MAHQTPPAHNSENGQLLDMLLNLIERLEKAPVPTGRRRRQRRRRTQTTRGTSGQGPTPCLVPQPIEARR